MQEHDAGADEAAVLDDAALEVGVVPHDAVGADDRGELAVQWTTVPSWTRSARRP